MDNGLALQNRLNSPIDLVWSQNPLRRAIRDLSHDQKVAVSLTAALIPMQTINILLTETPLRTALEEIAHRRGLGVSLLGPVVFLGPPEVYARLRTIAALGEEDVLRLPNAAAARFHQRLPLAWHDLARPRDVLKGLVEPVGITLDPAGLKRVPHDLWAAADLPPLTLVDRLTLVAVQFTYVCGFRRRPKRPPRAAAGARGRGAKLSGRGRPAMRARGFRRLRRRPKSMWPDGRVVVAGVVEDQDRIAHPTPPRRGETNRRSPRPETLHVDGDEPARWDVLRQLAGQLRLELSIDQAGLDRAGLSLETLVSFSVSNATIDELFEAATKSAGLSIHRRGRRSKLGRRNRRTGIPACSRWADRNVYPPDHTGAQRNRAATGTCRWDRQNSSFRSRASQRARNSTSNRSPRRRRLQGPAGILETGCELSTQGCDGRQAECNDQSQGDGVFDGRCALVAAIKAA